MIEVVGEIVRVETIAVGHGIRELARLERTYGPGRWRKRKGIAPVRVGSGPAVLAEVHWHEVSGVGRRELKIKRLLEE